MRLTGDDTSGSLVGLSFVDAFRAQEFLLAAKSLDANKHLKLNDAVIVVKNTDGRTTVQETHDLQPASSAISGAVWSGFIGLILGGPVGWVAGTVLGAGTGAAAAKVIDLGISDEWVEWFRDEVEPGTTTVVLLVEDVDRNMLVAEAARFNGAKLVMSTFEPSTMQRIGDALGSTIPVVHHDDDTAEHDTASGAADDEITSGAAGED
ncbi:MAG: DUF1269 domain-containing protein [Acidimicrobiales bacterium]